MDQDEGGQPVGHEAGWGVQANARLRNQKTAHEGLSKEKYRKECGRILQQYIPATSSSRLPKSFRDFIDRNEMRSPLGRKAIVAGLLKYDLSGMGAATGHFHRAQEGMTEEKLLAVEKAADLEG